MPRSVGGWSGPVRIVAPLWVGDGVGVGVPARNGELPGGGEVSGFTGGGAAVGVRAGAVGRGAVGVGEGWRDCAGDGDRVGRGDACVGEGDGLVGALLTTMLPLAVPAAPVAVTGWVLPAGAAE